MNSFQKYIAILMFFYFNIDIVIAQTTFYPKVSTGKIIRIENFKSKYVKERNIDIWLPENYSDSSKHAVLYMHDGQMLYASEQTWNHQSWDIDEVLSKLIQERKIKNTIVVGIWNSGNSRHSEYFPQKPFEELSKIDKDSVIAQLQKAGRTNEKFKPESNSYLKFLVNELIPYVNTHFSVYTNKKNTLIAGSSMGGLISLYAICEYPNVFGGAACLSTHWPGSFSLDNNPIPEAFLDYIAKNLPKPKNNRFYFDTGDQTLDSMYPEIQKKVDNVMQKKGYTENLWITRYFPGEDHSEKSWNKRLNIPIEFFLKK